MSPLERSIASALASKARLDLQPTVPGVFSIFDPAECGPDYVVSADGRSTVNTQTGTSSTQSSMATVARGSAGGIWQCEFNIPDYIGGVNISVGIGKNADFTVNQLGVGTTVVNASDGGFAVWDLNGSIYHNGAGSPGGVVGSWTTTTVIGLIFDATIPSNYLLSVYQDNGTIYKAWSTLGTLGAGAGSSDFTGDYYPGTGRGFVGSFTVTAFLNSGQEAFKRFVAGAAPWGR